MLVELIIIFNYASVNDATWYADERIDYYFISTGNKIITKQACNDDAIKN